MRYFYLLCLISLLCIGNPARSQSIVNPVAYTIAGGLYNQSFDGLPASGTFVINGKGPINLSGSPINGNNLGGWQVMMVSGSAANAGFVPGTGSGTGSGTYSFGSTASTDRALGTLASASGVYAIGVLFTNNTGSFLNSITVSFSAEQWRKGGSGNKNTWNFRYRTGILQHIDQSGLLPDNTLNFSSANFTTGAGSMNGNLPENQQQISYTINNISWKSGEQLLLRWDDNDEAGNDDASAIDNFSFSAKLVSALPAAITQTPSMINPFTAVLNGSVNDNYSKTTVAFEFDTTNLMPGRSSATAIPDTIQPGAGITGVSANLGGLLPGTKYYYRVKATNSNGTVYGAQMYFTTPITIPAVTTSGIFSVTANTAKAEGKVVQEDGSVIMEKGMIWWINGSAADAGNKITDTSSGKEIQVVIPDLPEGSIIKARAFASNAGGTAYGDSISFITPVHIVSFKITGKTKTNAGVIFFALQTGKNIGGLTAANFRINAAGVTGAAITEISTSTNNTCLIAVNTGIGDGTIGISLDNADGLSLPISNLPFVAENFFLIDKTPPTIKTTSLPNQSMKTGDSVPVLISINPDADTCRLITGSIDDFTLSAFSKINDSLYSAGFIVTAGARDIPAIEDIPVKIILADASGNNTDVYHTPIKQDSDLIDANRPVVISYRYPSPHTYKAGDDLDFIFHFSEKIKIAANANAAALSLTIGTKTKAASCITAASSDSLVFRYTIQNGDLDKDGIRVASNITSNNMDITDIAGNIASLVFSNTFSGTVMVDAVAPLISSIHTPPAGIYKTGNYIDFVVNFSKAVFCNPADSFPSLNLIIGSGLRNAVYISGNGSSAFLFRYMIQPDDFDKDGIKLVSPLQMGNGGLTDAAGNTAILSLSNIGALSGTRINPVTAAISKVLVPVDKTYITGDSMQFTLVYNEEVWVDTAAGKPSIKIVIGNNSRQVFYQSGSGTKELLFGYIVQQDETDTDGIKLSSSITLNNAVIKDINQQAVPTGLNNAGLTTGILVDAAAPIIKAIKMPDRKLYKAGDTLFFSLLLSEPVKLQEGNQTPYLVLTAGNRLCKALYVSGTGTDNLLFRYIILAGDEDKNGITTGNNVQTGSSTIKDFAGNEWINSFSTVSGKGILLDAIAPVVTTVLTPKAGYYHEGDSLLFRIIFSEDILVQDNNQLPFLQVLIGKNYRNIYLQSSHTDTLNFVYHITIEDEDPDGIQIDSSALNNVFSISDKAGNMALQGLHNIGNLSGIRINAIHAKVVGLVLPADSLYRYHDSIGFVLNFSEPVTVNTGKGIPSIAFSMGNSVKNALYQNGSGTSSLVFQYTIQQGDEGMDSIQLNNTILLNNAIITDSFNNMVLLDIRGLNRSNQIQVDAVAPFVSHVSVPKNGRYHTGDTLDFVFHFSEPVQITGSGSVPSLAITIGSKQKILEWQYSGTADSLLFRYIIQPGDLDSNGIKAGSSIQLNNTTIRDLAGNDAMIKYSSLNSKGILIDAVAPVITDVIVPPAGIYRTGNILDFLLVFSEPVMVTDSPVFLLLSISDKTVKAFYVSGSGSNRLLFRYQLEKEDSDGIIINTLITANETDITDLAGNPAISNLKNTASMTGIKINPVTASVKSLIIPPGGLYKTGDTLLFSVQYNESVWVDTGKGIPSLKLSIGNSSRQANYTGGTGNNEIIFSYTITNGDADTNGIRINNLITLNNGNIYDWQQKSVPLIVSTIPNTNKILIDGVAPFIKNISAPAGRLYKKNDSLEMVLHFSENVYLNATDSPYITTTVGKESKKIVYQSGSGTDTWLFRYIFREGDWDNNGITTGNSISLDNGWINDLAGNAAVSRFSTTSVKNITVDAQSPLISNIKTPLPGIYVTGNNLDFAVTYSEKIFVSMQDSIPSLKIKIGDEEKTALYLSGSGSETLLFRYVIDAADKDRTGITLLPNQPFQHFIVKDLAGNNALPFLFTANTLTGVLVNPVSASISKCNFPANGLYKTGDTLDFMVHYSETVLVDTVKGTPSVKITVGKILKQALYTDGSGTNNLHFIYIIKNGDEDNDGITINNSITLNNGLLTDSFHFNVPLNWLMPDSTNNILIDGIAPVVTAFQPPAGKVYITGDTLDFLIRFSEKLVLNRQNNFPYLQITIGNTTKNAAYLSGSGTDQWIFRSVVKEGDLDKNGIRIGNSIQLNNTSAIDQAGNFLVPAIKNTGVPAAIIIDAVKPQFTKPLSDTVTVCENGKPFLLNDFLSVNDTELNESISCTVQNLGKNGWVTKSSWSGLSNGKNVTPDGIIYTPLSGRHGTDTILASISDGYNSSGKKIVIRINPSISNNLTDTGQIICINAVPEKLTGSVPAGGNGQYNFLWESSANDAAGFMKATGNNSLPDYLPDALKTNTWFRRIVYSGSCADTSQPVQIKIWKNGIWTGGSSNNWLDAKNWCANILPGNTMDVIIDTKNRFTPIISDTAKCGNLFITDKSSLLITGILEIYGAMDGPQNIIHAKEGTIIFSGNSNQSFNGKLLVDHEIGSLKINNSAALVLTDSLQLNNTLTLSKGSLQTNDFLLLKNGATIGASASGTFIKGNVFMQHLIKGGKRAFVMQGHPFGQNLSLQMLKDSIDITGEGGSVNGFTGTASNQPSAFYYHEQIADDSTGFDAGWTAFTNTNGTGNNLWMENKGIRLFMRGRPGQGLDGTPAGNGSNGSYLPLPVMLQLSGPLHTGNYEVTFTGNKRPGYQVVANPYPAYINLSSISLGNTIGPNFWIWNPLQGSQGGYSSIPFSNGFILPPFGSFIVRTNGDSGTTLLFTENCKTTEKDTDTLPSVNMNDTHLLELRLWKDSLFYDRILLLGSDTAKTGFDKNDAEKFDNSEINFYSLSKEQKKLSIDARPINNDSKIVLGIRSVSNGNFRIGFTKIQLPATNRLMLHDNYLGQWITLSQDSMYVFNINNDSLSKGDHRFVIEMQPNKTDTLKPVSKMIMAAGPVPATDKIMVKYQAPEAGETMVSLLTISGTPVKIISLGMQKKGEIEIPVGHLVKGIYLVKVQCGNYHDNRKIIIH